MRQIGLVFALLVLSLLLPASRGQGTCPNYNYAFLTTGLDMLDNKEHSITTAGVYGHGVFNSSLATCEYDDAPYGIDNCSAYCTDTLRLYASKFENSGTLTLTSLIARHAVAADESDGSGETDSGSISCSAQEAVEVVSCSRYALVCTASVSIGVSGVGVSFGPNYIWKTSHTDVHTCSARKGYNGTPVLIDTDGRGFHLSSSLEGVAFNFFGTGLIQTAWPVPGSTNGWLVLPDADFMVPTAQQMFGNQTGYANGFLQLAQYDDNHDGVIDAQDAIYNQLYVWIDANRDGVSQPGELHPLRDTIESISLRYTESKRVDDNGNAFRYKGIVKPVPGNHVSPVIVDVILSFGDLVAK